MGTQSFLERREAGERTHKVGVEPVPPLPLSGMEDAFSMQLRMWMGAQKLEVVDLARAMDISGKRAKGLWEGSRSICMSDIAEIAAWQGITPVQLLLKAEGLLVGEGAEI